MKKIVIPSLLLIAVLFGVYKVLTKIDNDFRFGRMRETPAVRPHEKPLPVMADESVPVSGGEAIFRAVPAEKLQSPLTATPGVIKQGQILYFTYCAQCHGKYHDGNGTVGQSFYPLPTDIRSKRVQSLSDGILFKNISYGLPEGKQPPLASTISILDRWRIIAFIKSLGN